MLIHLFSLIINRIFYSAALLNNVQNLDISDFIDPSDHIYNNTLQNTLNVISRDQYSDYLPCSIVNGSVLNVVTGVNI